MNETHTTQKYFSFSSPHPLEDLFMTNPGMLHFHPCTTPWRPLELSGIICNVPLLCWQVEFHKNMEMHNIATLNTRGKVASIILHWVGRERFPAYKPCYGIGRITLFYQPSPSELNRLFNEKTFFFLGSNDAKESISKQNSTILICRCQQRRAHTIHTTLPLEGAQSTAHTQFICGVAHICRRLKRCCHFKRPLSSQ